MWAEDKFKSEIKYFLVIQKYKNNLELKSNKMIQLILSQNTIHFFKTFLVLYLRNSIENKIFINYIISVDYTHFKKLKNYIFIS
jgi:hypothetical protein